MENNNKQCKRCQEHKSLECFSKSSGAKTGRHTYCKECCKIKKKEWASNNKEYIARKAKEYNQSEHGKRVFRAYYQRNSEKIKRKNNEYRRKESAKIKARIAGKLRRERNPSAKIAGNLRNRLRIALKNFHKSQSAIGLLGCSLEYFKEYLEAKFLPGMSWDNYANDGWHIDHIIPCAAFNLTKLEQQKVCFHYSNLQPLWQKDNLSKGARIE